MIQSALTLALGFLIGWLAAAFFDNDSARLYAWIKSKFKRGQS